MTTTRSIPWLRILIEGVVIVGSILLAFGIDAAWTERQERAEERRLLVDLRAEFHENRDLLTTSIQSHEQALAEAEWLLESPTSRMELGTTDVQGVVFGVFAGFTTFHPKSGVLEGILSWGSARGSGGCQPWGLLQVLNRHCCPFR